MKKMKKKLQIAKRKKKGFTLVELIVVLVILAILAAILLPSLLGYIDQANEKKYILECRSCVQAAQGLITEQYAAGGDALDTWTGEANAGSRHDQIKELADVQGEITTDVYEGGIVSELVYEDGGVVVTYRNQEYTIGRLPSTGGGGDGNDSSGNTVSFGTDEEIKNANNALNFLLENLDPSQEINKVTTKQAKDANSLFEEILGPLVSEKDEKGNLVYGNGPFIYDGENHVRRYDYNGNTAIGFECKAYDANNTARNYVIVRFTDSNNKSVTYQIDKENTLDVDWLTDYCNSSPAVIPDLASKYGDRIHILSTS